MAPDLGRARPRHPAHGPASHDPERGAEPQEDRPATPPASRAPAEVADRPVPPRLPPVAPSRPPLPRAASPVRLPGAPLLVLAALALEADALARALPGAARLGAASRNPYPGIVWAPGPAAGARVPPVFVLRTGMGCGALAEAGVVQAIEAAHPSAVVSAGFAGALDGALDVGHLVVGEPVVDPTLPGHYWPSAPLAAAAAAAARAAGLELHAGPLVSVGRVEATSAGKAAFALRSRALALDMESACVARAAAHAVVPFLAVRVVSDAAADILPEEAWRLVTADGRAPLHRAVGYLARRPSALPGLVATGRRARRAAAALSAFLAAWLAQAGR